MCIHVLYNRGSILLYARELTVLPSFGALYGWRSDLMDHEQNVAPAYKTHAQKRGQKVVELQHNRQNSNKEKSLKNLSQLLFNHVSVDRAAELGL